MEEKKFDPYQFIGFILIAVILTWMLYRNGPAEEAAPAEEDAPAAAEEAADASDADAPDYASMTVAELKDELKAKGLPVSGKKAELIERLQGA